MASKEEYLDKLTVNPFDLDMRFEYARFLLANGELDNAMLQLQMLVNQAPDNQDFQSAFQQCQSMRGDSPTTDTTPALAEEPSKLQVLPGGRQTLNINRDENVALLPSQPARITFDDIVGMKDVKKSVRLKIIEPFLNPGLFSKFGKRSGGGIMLYGPPGCGKTMLAKAIAVECNVEFISVSISDVMDSYIGQSERNIRDIFEQARTNKPCVLFFDELDALAMSRSKSSQDHSRTIVNELLSQMDGMGSDNEEVLILGATNMPWDVDSAAKRPGRFAKQFFVPPLDDEARAELFRKRLSRLPCEEIDFEKLASVTKLCSGADIDGIIEEAKEKVLDEILESGNERNLKDEDLAHIAKEYPPSSADWLRTARNLVKFGGVDRSYKEVATYLKSVKLD